MLRNNSVPRNFARELANTSCGTSGSGYFGSCKTPAGSKNLASKTPCSASRVGRTPSKTPGKATGKTPGKSNGSANSSSRNITPSRNQNFSSCQQQQQQQQHGAKTPGGGDRYIPNRSASQFELAHFHMTNQSQNNESQQSHNDSSSAPTSPAKAEFQRNLRDNLNGGVTAPKSHSLSDLAKQMDSSCNILDMTSNSNIFAYKKGQAPAPRQGFTNQNRVLYSARAPTAASCGKKTMRHIPAREEKILDAPDVIDDYYLSFLSWSEQNQLAVCLNNMVYLWNASSGEIDLLTELTEQNQYVSSARFGAIGQYIGVGLSGGQVELWSVDPPRKLRNLDGHTGGRVACLTWNQHILTSGSRNGYIMHSDVRVPQHNVAYFQAHTQEVCGLRWSPDGRYLASGGNDNVLNIFAQANEHRHSESNPVLSFNNVHLAAVKALSWCPWQPSILASGGGTADRTIRLWSTNQGSCMRQADAQSQVCSILWNAEYKELISGHGYPSHQLTIWKYPELSRICELSGHTGRILDLASSPCGEYVMSISADESLRLWRCFAADPSRKNSKSRAAVHQQQVTQRGLIAANIR